MAKWRSIALLLVVIFSRPLCLLWQNFYLEPGQNYTALLLAITVSLDLMSLLACVLLGANRSKTLVAAAFVYSIISIAQIPAVCFISLVIQPLTDIQRLPEITREFPQVFYSGLFFNNIIITVCCLLAARWLPAKTKPSPKILALFSITFILIALIVLVWFSDIINITSISLLASGLLGTLLLGILLLLFYLYTRLFVHSDNLPAGKEDYTQFIQHLSKRELQVIEAILAGNDSYKKLASALNISVNTVKTHLKHIYQTTGVSNITALSSLFSGFRQNRPPITHKSPENHLER